MFLCIFARDRPGSKNTITYTLRGPQQTGANGGSFLGDSLLNELLLAADESTCLSPGARGQWPVSTTGLSSDSPGLCASGHCTGTCAERRGFHGASLGFLAFPFVCSCFLDPMYVLAYKTSCRHDRTCAREAHVQTHTRPGVFLIAYTSWFTKPRVFTIQRESGKPTSRGCPDPHAPRTNRGLEAVIEVVIEFVIEVVIEIVIEVVIEVVIAAC